VKKPHNLSNKYSKILVRKKNVLYFKDAKYTRNFEPSNANAEFRGYNKSRNPIRFIDVLVSCIDLKKLVFKPS
jgi:hypothetical protein